MGRLTADDCAKVNRALVACCLVLFVAVACGCGGSEGDEGDEGNSGVDAGNSNVTCSASAVIDADNDQNILTATGRVTCDDVTAIMVESCVQSNSSGSFEDLMCASTTMSNIDALEQATQVGCPLTAGSMFRARVAASANGATLSETLSTEVPCDR